MQGSVGEKLGEGHYAEVYAWAPRQVVKLFRANVPRRTSRYEAHMTRAVYEAGGPGPEVLGEVTLDGRHGIVLRRFDGPTLTAKMREGELALAEGAAILAGLALSVHLTPPPADALSLSDYMTAFLKRAGDQLPAPIATGIVALIDRLPPDNRLSHCDLHPGNVILTDEGPKLVDWTGVKRGGAHHDLACSHFLRTELLPEGLGAPGQQQAFDRAMQREYARLIGMPASGLAAAVEAHMPVVRAFFLLGAMPRPATRDRLLKRLEQDVAQRSEA